MTEPDIGLAATEPFARPSDVEAEFEGFDDDEFTEAAEDADSGTTDDDAAEAEDELSDIDDDVALDDEDPDGEFDDGRADLEYHEDDYDEAAKARLAAALAEVNAQFGKKPAEQVNAFTQAQQTLQATLARIDTN